ncbi:hypothetical protein EZV62_021246 [Acer yangbiense]|uniref:Uncharacterized protein n=1 Tax=Acer yangbiense TaxID=1000413 RepID=A0A5C7H530_9ROSI|nr:hypothetical protein EZV62_021246 [Acer yangbiense]
MAKYLKPLKMFEEGLKRTQYENTVFLGLNFGNKYVSMAISDDCYVSAFAYRGGGAPPGEIAMWRRRSAPPWSRLLLVVDRSLLVEENRLLCKECLLVCEEQITHRGSPPTVKEIDLEGIIVANNYPVGAEKHCELFRYMFRGTTFPIQHSQRDLIDASSAVHMLRANLDFFNALVGRESGEDPDSEDSE